MHETDSTSVMQREVGPGISSGAYCFFETNHWILVILANFGLEIMKTPIFFNWINS
jgi:hypothetical protein